MKNILIVFSIVLFFTSCTKIVDIDLNKTNPQLVVEAIVSDKNTTQTIKLTKTVNFSDANVYPKVTGAIVSIAEGTNPRVNCVETAPGIYTASGFVAVPGRTYSLLINTEGKTYTAVSTMPVPVLYDSISFEQNFSFNPSDDTTYSAVPKYKDPASLQNNYWIEQSVNGLKDKTIFVFNDNINNGGFNNRPLFSNDEDFEIKRGNTVVIDVYGIDKPVYEYLYALSLISGGQGNATTPANPTSNITGGALGFFSAQCYQSKTVVK